MIRGLSYAHGGLSEASTCESEDNESSGSDVDSGESEPAPTELSSLVALSASEIRTPVTWLMFHVMQSAI